MSRLDYKEIQDGVELICRYDTKKHGVMLTARIGFAKVQQFISFRYMPIIGMAQVINLTLQEMKRDALEQYKNISSLW